jgi:hypothetical protein
MRWEGALPSHFFLTPLYSRSAHPFIFESAYCRADGNFALSNVSNGLPALRCATDLLLGREPLAKDVPGVFFRKVFLCEQEIMRSAEQTQIRTIPATTAFRPGTNVIDLQMPGLIARDTRR